MARTDSIQELTAEVSSFARVRRWGRFHSPKNLSMGIAIEAAELMEQFQWLTAEESFKRARGKYKEEVADELADVAVFVLRMAEVCNIDLGGAILAKLDKNAQKYPVELVRGKPHKYTYYLAKKRWKAKQGATK